MKSANFYVWETPAQHFSSWSYAGRLLHLDGSRCHRAQLRVKWSAIEPSPGIAGEVFLLEKQLGQFNLSSVSLHPGKQMDTSELWGIHEEMLEGRGRLGV